MHRMIVMHGLPQCDTCRKARAWLDERAVAYRFSDYREQPLADDELLRFSQQLGWEKLVNRASLTWRKLPESDRSPGTPDEWLSLARAHPSLLKRPLLVMADGSAHVGFNASRYADLLAG